MNDYYDLKDGLKVLAGRVQKEDKYKTNPIMREANAKLLHMCSRPRCIYVFENENDLAPINVTRRSLFKVNRLLHRHGIDWTRLSWKAVLEWLYDNWDKVIRVMLSLLTLILL